MFGTALNRKARPHGKLLLMPHIMVSEFIGKEKVPTVYGYVELNVNEYQADCDNKRFCGLDVTEYSTNLASVKSQFCKS